MTEVFLLWHGRVFAGKTLLSIHKTRESAVAKRQLVSGSDWVENVEHDYLARLGLNGEELQWLTIEQRRLDD